MTIYYVNNPYDSDEDNEYIEDAYYIKNDNPICNKMDIYVALFNITITSLVFYYLSTVEKAKLSLCQG